MEDTESTEAAQEPGQQSTGAAGGEPAVPGGAVAAAGLGQAPEVSGAGTEAIPAGQADNPPAERTEGRTRTAGRRWWLAPALLASPCLAFGATGIVRLLRRPPDACGGSLACQRCELRPEFPFWAFRCSECSASHHWNESRCEVNHCHCGGGVAAQGVACLRDHGEVCVHCTFGYHRAGVRCAANRCNCRRGSPLADGHCPADGAEGCSACHRGFHLEGTDCMPNRCICSGGRPAEGAACDVDGAERCSRCDGGLHLLEQVCQKNRCTCQHGRPLTGLGCERDGAERCSSCDEGFHMASHSLQCAQNECFCHHGAPLTGTSCSRHQSESCEQCDAGYHLVESICKQNRCTCRGGNAPVGVACAEDGAWRCSTCWHGFQMRGVHCDAFVRVFAGAAFVSMDRGAPDLLADLRDLGYKASAFTGRAKVDWENPNAAVVVVPELNSPLELNKSLADWVRHGGHLVVCGDYFGHNGRFLNAMFGWKLQGVLSFKSAALGLDCGIFCDGPTDLEWSPGVSCYAASRLPTGVHAAYNDAASACVFTAEKGHGRVTYLGFDWYNSTRLKWTKVLHLTVLGSG